MEEYLNLQRERSHKNVVCEPLDQTELLMRHLGQRRTQLAGLRPELQIGSFATFSSSSFGKR